MDARQRRSQEALHAAIIDLASTQPVSGLTVSQITDQAGVNRSTFYAHASSPSELLVAALTVELDALRDRFLAHARGDWTMADSLRDISGELLTHLENHADLYLLAFDSPSDGSSLRTMLAEHSRATLELALADRALEIPGLDGRPDHEAAFVATAAASYAAAGSAAVLELWLRTPEPRDRTLYAQTTQRFAPEWWPTSSPAPATA